jgi:hypothetical protein
MGTCTRCGTPRSGGDRCQFCGMSHVAQPAASIPAGSIPAASIPVAPEPPVPAYQVPAYQVPTPSYQAPTYQQPTDWAVTVPAYTPRPAPPSSDAGTVGFCVAAVLGPYLLLCVLLTAVVALSIGDGHAGSPADWVRGGVVAAALGLRGTAFASFDALGQDVSFHLTATPLVLLAAALVLTWYVGRQAEQKSPSRDEAHTAVRSLAGAVGVVAGLGALALLSRFSAGFGVDDFEGGTGTFGAQLLPMLIALPMLAAAFALGRRGAWRKANGLTSVRDELDVRTQGLSEQALCALQHLALTGALLLAVVGVVALVTTEDPLAELSDAVHANAFAALVYLVLALPNLAVAGVGMLLGMGLHADGTGSSSPGDDWFGILRGNFDGSDHLYLLLPVAVGLFLSARRAQAGRESVWWRAGAASVLVWLVLWQLTTVGFGVSGVGESAGGTISFGIVGLVVASFAWGAGLQVVGKLLADHLGRRAPTYPRYTPVPG